VHLIAYLVRNLTGAPGPGNPSSVVNF